jgi:ATP-binding cassette subfamily A (ABC1) protein 5
MVNLMIQILVFHFAAWYFAQVFGSSLGQNRRAWFLFTTEFWGFETEEERKLRELKAMHQRAAQGGGGGVGNSQANAFLGSDRLTNEQFLSLRNQELRTYKLSKSYKSTSALKEATLKMEKNSLTCLLGHNGAGKSTLVNVLTGLNSPTFGSAWMFGQSIANVHKIQRDMGVCMQDDILFEASPRERPSSCSERLEAYRTRG